MTTATGVGLSCCLASVLLFGSNYLPVKRYEVGDGLFFQWLLCCGIYLVGVSVNSMHLLSATPPPFQPLAALGGVTWCTGQLLVVPIVRLIGIAKGLIIWGGTAIVVGWACGACGILGVRSEAHTIKSWPLNVAGVALALCSLLTSLLLRPTIDQPRTSPSLERGLLSEGGDRPNSPPCALAEWTESLNPRRKQVVGVSLAVCAGLFYGTNFVRSTQLCWTCDLTTKPQPLP